jgi:hypothetical protein
LRPKRNYLDKYIVFTVIFCFFSPKLFIFKYGGAGLRFDDLLILLAALILLAMGIMKSITVPKIATPFLLYVLFACFSSVYNGFLGRVDMLAGIIFSARHLEYFVFFYLGSYLSLKEIDLDFIFRAYVIMLIVLVPLQMMGALPVVSDFGASRAMANTNGPYELALVAAFLVFYFFYGVKPSVPRGLVSIIVLFATASRITNVAVWLVIFLVHRKFTLRSTLGMFVVAFSIFSFVALTGESSREVSGDSLTERMESLLDGEIFYELGERIDSMALASKSSEFLRTDYIQPLEDVQTLSVDASAYIRFYRWLALLKNTFSKLDSSLFGLGPSFSSVAVDGFFVRLIAETGLIGFVLYVSFIVRGARWARKVSRPFSYYLVTLVASGLVIDIFLSYKVMLLFWLYFGYLWANTQKDTSLSA